MNTRDQENWDLARRRILERASVDSEEPTDEFARQIVKAARERRSEREKLDPSRSRAERYFPLAVAAGALIIGGALVYLILFGSENRTESVFGDSHIVWMLDDNDSKKTRALESGSLIVGGPDGTKIRSSKDDTLSLSPSSVLEFQQITKRGTNIRLQKGGVFCRVSPRDTAGTFIVEAGRFTVTVVGTSFTVSKEGSTVSVRVEEGTVQVKDEGGELRLLEAGEVFEHHPKVVSPDSINADGIGPGESAEEAPRKEPGKNAVRSVEKQGWVEESDAVADLGTIRDWIIEGRHEEAKVALEKKIRDEGPKTEILILLSDCHRKMGDHKAALGTLDRALETADLSMTGKVIFMSGVILQDHLNDPAGAADRFNRYLEGGSKRLEGPAMLRLARTYEQTGNNKRAKEILEVVVAKFEGTPIAQRAQQILGNLMVGGVQASESGDESGD